MKKASELVTAIPRAGQKDHKNRAATFRRLAGGLRSQASEHGSAGFSEEERLVLVKAALLLEAAGEQAVKAASLLKLKEQNRIARSDKLKALIMAECDELVDLTDRVAFVVVVDSRLLYLLKCDVARHAHPLVVLREQMKTAAQRLAESLALEESQMSPEELVDKAFEDFNKKKHAFIQLHRRELDDVMCSLRSGAAAHAVIAKAQSRS